MSAHLVTPLQKLFRWLDERPAVRLLGTLALAALAVFTTLPGWALDLWLVCSLTAAIGTSTLLVAVGREVAPREVLAGLPAFMRRGFFQRLALAIALTKAIVTGQSPGVLMEWLAQGGLAGSAGVGLAAVAAIYVAQLSLGAFFSAEAERQAPDLAEAAREIFGLLRRHAYLGLALTACLLAAGLVTGLLIRQWPLNLTLTAITLYGLAEACFTALPGLIVGMAMAHWLGQAAETVEDAPGSEVPAAPPVMALEVGRELAPALRRAVPMQLAALRARLDAELGLPLPRVGLSVTQDLPARMARVRLHGLPERWIELAEFEPLDAIAQLLEDVVRTRADSLLTIDATRARLDELAVESPVAVQQVLSALGLPAVHGVLKGLLREQVPIRDLNGLIETLVLRAGEDRSVPVLVEHARRAQAHAISVRVASDAGAISALELGAGWDEVLAAFPSWDTGLTADWTAGRSLADACRQALAATPGGPARPVLLVPRRYRPLVAEMLRAHGLDVPVLAPDEVSSRFTLRLAGSVPRPSEHPVH